MKKSLMVVLLFVGLIVVLSSVFVKANICDGGAIDCTDGGDKVCLEECENWVTGDKKDDDYYMGACGMWKCASKKRVLLQSSEEGCSKSSFIKWIDNEEYNKVGYAGGNCIFESKKKFCAKTKDCPDKFVCRIATQFNSFERCDCPNGASVKDRIFNGCCPAGEKAFFGTDDFSPGSVYATSICCGQGVSAVVLRRMKISWDGPRGEFPEKCCAPGEHNSYDFLTETEQCCPENEEWSFSEGEKGGCVSPCCRDDNDCSTACGEPLKLFGDKKIPQAVRIEKQICEKAQGADKGQCVFSSMSGEVVDFSLGEECVTKTIKEGEKSFVPDNPCGSKKVATIVCGGDEFCNSFCDGETTDAAGIKLDVVDKGGCLNGKGYEGGCIQSKNKETCEKGKVCVEHISPSELNIKAKCEECPNIASFNGATNTPSAGVEDNTNIFIRGDNPRQLKKENSFITFTPEKFFDRIASLCDKCPKKKSGKKLDNVFLFTHGNSDGPIFVNENGEKVTLDAIKVKDILNKDNKRLSKKLKNCVGEFILAGCDVAAGSVGGVLAKELNTRVVAGTTTNFADYDPSCERSEIEITNPKIIGGKGKKGFIKTIYYLTKPNDVYPGFGREVYQAKVVNGSLGEVEIQIESNDNDVLFVEMNEETMPCKSTIADEKLFAIAPNMGKIEFYNFSIKVLSGTFSQKTDNAKVIIRRLDVDCSNYEDIYNNKIELLTKSQMNEIEELYGENYTTQEYYDDFKYRYENQLECTKEEHCLGLRCPMNNLSCAYVCKSGKCELEAGNRRGVGVGADSNNDGVVSLSELVNYIQKWINGEVSLNGLTGAIQGWISGGTSTSGGGSGGAGGSGSGGGSGNNASGSGSGDSRRPGDKPENGLVGYWNFDEGSGRVAYDVSGNKNDRVITDAGFVNGKVGKALEFNGSGIVSIPHSDRFNFGVGQFTLIAWIKMYSPALDAPQHIIGKRDNTGGGNWVRLMANNGYLITEYSQGMQESSQSPHADGKWHQIALVKEDNENAFFYFDRSAMVISIPTNVSNSGEFTIGKWDGESSFNGVIDEVKVYNRALGQNEIIGMFESWG